MPLKKSVKQLIAQAESEIDTLDAEQAIARSARDDTVIVDLRDIRERVREGFVAGSLHVPRGMLEFWIDPSCKYHRDVFAQPEKTYVFFCAAAWRSALATRDMQNMGLAPVAHIEGGFAQWRDSGLPITSPEPTEPEKSAT